MTFLAMLFNAKGDIKQDVPYEAYEELKATGEWFDSPKEATEAEIAKKEAELATVKKKQAKLDKEAIETVVTNG